MAQIGYGPRFPGDTASARAASDNSAVTIPWDPGNANEAFGIIAAGLDARPTQWDQLIIGDNVLPGICKIEGGKRCKLDRKATMGSTGENISPLGMANGEIYAHIIMWTDEQVNTLRLMMPKLLPAASIMPQPDPVQVYHPALALLGITALIVEHMDLPKVSQAGGTVEMTIRFLEHLPPRPVANEAVFSRAQSLSDIKRAHARLPTPTKPSATRAVP